MAVWLRSARWLAVLFAMLGPTAAIAQGHAASLAGSATPETVTDVLRQMSGRAEVIFVGQVVEVRSSSAPSGVVEVDFRVDAAIRGCTTGTYTLHEWAGMWGVNGQRYRAGQQLLMLLHAPSAAGLSSPVDGLNGAIPIRPVGTATPYVGIAAEARIVDLRWLGAKLPRSPSYRSSGAVRAGRELPPVPFVATPETVVTLRSGAASPVQVMLPASGEISGGSVPAEQASVDAVVSMLKTWEGARYAAP